MKEQIIKNPLLVNFLNQDNNAFLFEKYKESNSPELEYILNQNFYQFYYKIRVLSYFSKIIDFEAKRYDKKLRDHNKKFSLLLDKPSDDNNREGSNKWKQDNSTSGPLPLTIEDIFSIDIMNELTHKQKKILTMVYMRDLKDTEIAKLLGVSQQSITKTKKTALDKLRRLIGG